MITWNEYNQGANPFISATRILEVTATAGAQQLKDGKGAQFWAQTMIPTIVMKAFSCELMLKAFVSHDTGSQTCGHKLNELFGQLSHSTQADISNDVIAEIKRGTPSYDLDNFKEDLDKAANLFVDWRYFFEQSTSGEMKSANLTFLQALFITLEKKRMTLA